MDKLNHCTAFKPKSSPPDNKYTHADIQVRWAAASATDAHGDSLASCRRGAEVSGLQNQETEGPTGAPRGPAAQGPRLREVLRLSNARRRKRRATGTEPGAKGSSSGQPGSAAGRRALTLVRKVPEILKEVPGRVPAVEKGPNASEPAGGDDRADGFHVWLLGHRLEASRRAAPSGERLPSCQLSRLKTIYSEVAGRKPFHSVGASQRSHVFKFSF